MQKPIGSRRGIVSNKNEGGRIGLPHVLDEVGGQACGFCGWQHYHLVLRANAKSAQASLVAKCSRCDEEIVGFSVEKLHKDLDRYGNVDH